MQSQSQLVALRVRFCPWFETCHMVSSAIFLVFLFCKNVRIHWMNTEVLLHRIHICHKYDMFMVGVKQHRIRTYWFLIQYKLSWCYFFLSYFMHVMVLMLYFPIITMHHSCMFLHTIYNIHQNASRTFLHLPNPENNGMVYIVYIYTYIDYYIL
jgi:hypothetical protein